VIFANIFARVSLCDYATGGSADRLAMLYEAATLDGATNGQRFRFITYPLLTPIIAVVMTFSVLFTFTDFQLIWALTRGGPVNSTHLMRRSATARHPERPAGEGAAIAPAMIRFCWPLLHISWFGMPAPKWRKAG